MLAIGACTSSTVMDGGSVTVSQGVGANCTNSAECRSDLACDPGTHTCQPTGAVTQGMPCTITGDCAPGLFCNYEGAAPACAPAGNALPGATCTDTASCVRGAVCVRNAPGLYGVCEVPRGGEITGPDGGTLAFPDGQTPSAGAGNDIGGACMSQLDCLAGLTCASGSNTCQPPAPGIGAATPWAGETCTPDDTGSTKAYFEIPAADGTPPHDFFRLPFPNDIRRDPSTGHINLNGFPHPGNGIIGFDLVQRYALASQQDLDGFGTNQDVYFRFSGGIDFQTLHLGPHHPPDRPDGECGLLRRLRSAPTQRATTTSAKTI